MAAKITDNTALNALTTSRTATKLSRPFLPWEIIDEILVWTGCAHRAVKLERYSILIRKIDPEADFNWAIRFGYLGYLKYLNEKGLCTGSYNHDDMTFSLSNSLGSLDVLKYCHEQIYSITEWERGIEAFKRPIMDRAAYHGHLDIIKYLHSIGSKARTYAMDNAAGINGRIEVVKWFHENRQEGCTTRAMNMAASQGHLEIVKFLHENRTEGCTANAMNDAAMNGHLEVIKWLHENRTEGCTADAMDSAAKYGYLEVVKWLHENRTEGCTAFAMDSAAKYGYLEVLSQMVS
jgi:Ankyrin repeats (3 copies)